MLPYPVTKEHIFYSHDCEGDRAEAQREPDLGPGQRDLQDVRDRGGLPGDAGPEDLRPLEGLLHAEVKVLPFLRE